jgi:hypothetical protein
MVKYKAPLYPVTFCLSDNRDELPTQEEKEVRGMAFRIGGEIYIYVSPDIDEKSFF